MAQTTFSWPFGPIHLESACLRFRLAAKTAPAPLFLLFPANPLRWASPGVTMDWAKRHRGRLRMSAPRSYSPYPGPHYGGRVPESTNRISGAQNLSGWSQFPPGHRALGLQKLPLVRFHTCAWVSRTNAPGRYAVGPVWDRPLREKGAASISAVGAAVSRLQAFPLGGRCPSAHTGADEGAMIERFFV